MHKHWATYEQECKYAFFDQLVYVSEDLVQNGGGQVLRMMQPFLYIFMSLTSFCFRIHI